MPTTVTSSSGTVYHLWQLPDDSSRGIEAGVEFSTLRNDLGNGYRSQLLYGSSTGLRKWSLRLPTLADTTVLTNTVTGPNGETLSREAYLWELYTENQVAGTPFVYTDPRTGQYYLCEFTNKDLNYEKQFRVKLYGTGVEIQQVRLPGETVFKPANTANGDNIADFNELSPFDSISWDSLYLGTDFQALNLHGNVDQTGTQNGLDTMQFNVGATNDGYVLSDTNGVNFTCCEAFFVMKMREATFSNNAGIFTTEITGAALIGDTGTTKFFNLGLSNFEYRKNDVLYAQSNMQAPMNTYGIVHIRNTTGAAFFAGKFQIGKDRDFAGRFAELDLAEFIAFSDLQPKSYRRELLEHLSVKWDIALV